MINMIAPFVFITIQAKPVKMQILPPLFLQAGTGCPKHSCKRFPQCKGPELVFLDNAHGTEPSEARPVSKILGQRIQQVVEHIPMCEAGLQFLEAVM